MSPALDSYWLTAIDFLKDRLQNDAAVLAPNEFKEHIQPCLFRNYRASFQGATAASFNIVVVHKGLIDRIQASLLDAIDQTFVPIFANEVFVIFSRSDDPKAAEAARGSSHLQAYWDMRSQESSVLLKGKSTPTSPTAFSSRTHQHREPLATEESSPPFIREFVPDIDVLLCSYRKCGRTWLRYMLAFYINERCGFGYEPSITTMVMLVPPFAVSHKVPLDIIQTERYAGEFGLRAIAASHQTYNNPNALKNLKEKDVVFLFRSVCDVLVSQHFELVFRRGFQPRETIWEFIQTEHLLESYVTYLNAWADNLDNHRHLILTYEEMKANTVESVRRVLQFLGTNVDEDTLAHAVHLASFENMQKMERRDTGIDESSKDTSRLRTRRGKIGGYRDYLGDAAVATIRQYCKDNLSVKAKRMFDTHHIDVF
ncbi:MAG: sulfotransferase domain-containing protein [Cyanobacteria bacterium P01_A01_bin.37]